MKIKGAWPIPTEQCSAKGGGTWGAGGVLLNPQAKSPGF